MRRKRLYIMAITIRGDPLTDSVCATPFSLIRARADLCEGYQATGIPTATG